MLMETLEGRSLFAATLPMAAAVLPLTPANSHASDHLPAATVPSQATDAALSHLADALAHHAQGKP